MKNLPRETTIAGQRHMLAYINPFEVDLLRSYGGSQTPGPGGVPAFPPTAAQKKEIERQQAERAAERAAQRDDRAPPGTYSGTGVSLKTEDTPAGPKTVSSASPVTSTAPVKTTAELRAEKAARDDSDRDARPAPAATVSTSAAPSGPAPAAPVAPGATMIGPVTPQQIADLRAGVGQRNFLEQAFGMTLPGQIMLGLKDRELQQIADKLEGKYENQGILGLGIGKGLFERGAVSYQGVFDPQGNVVGALGFNEAGEPVDYTGQRLEGFESGNPAIDALVRPSEAGLAGADRDEGPISTAADPCPEGYEMDPVARVCVLKRTDVTQPVGPAPVGPAPVAPPPPPPLPPVAVAPPPPPQYTQVGPRPGVPPLMPYGAPPAAQQTIYTPPPAMQGQGIMQNLR